MQDLKFIYISPYVLIFFIAATPVLLNYKFSQSVRNLFWYLQISFLILFVGFRHHVGGDWMGFATIFNRIADKSEFDKFLFYLFDFPRSDFGYDTISWIVAQLGYSVYTLNFILAVFFMFALSSYLRKQDNPSLGLVIAIPYVITIIAMGYVRQGVAFSFLLLAINYLTKDKKYLFLVLIVLGTLFHKSVIIMSVLFFVSPTVSKKSVIYLSLILLVVILIFKDGFFQLYNSYLGKGRITVLNVSGLPFESKGAIYRLIINSVPAVIFLYLRDRLTNNVNEKRIYLFLSVVTLSSFIFVNHFSILVDRILIYFVPLQIFVFSRLSRILNSNLYSYLLNNSIVTAYAVYYVYWLNFSNHAHKWLPYKNIILN